MNRLSRRSPSVRARVREERKRRRRSLREDAFNVPNLLTMARVLGIPIVLLLARRK